MPARKTIASPRATERIPTRNRIHPPSISRRARLVGRLERFAAAEQHAAPPQSATNAISREAGTARGLLPAGPASDFTSEPASRGIPW
jgi:hypothetical protein